MSWLYKKSQGDSDHPMKKIKFSEIEQNMVS